jgi:Ubiquitin-2 like Rad60 SUMO-like
MNDDEELVVGRINVFEFKKKSFQPKKKLDDDSCSDDDDDVVNVPLAASTHTNAKTLLLQLDNEYDSDIEIIPKHSKPKVEACHAILLDESDDDSITVIPTTNQSIDSISKAREARECLQQAQMYHAEDILEKYDGGNLPITLSNRSKGIEHSISITYMAQKIKWTLYHLEPIQKVLDQLRHKFGIPLNHSMQLQRQSSKKEEEAEILDPTKTPASYGFGKVGTKHLILRVIEGNSTSKSSSSASGPRICLRVRTIRHASNIILADETFVIRQRDTFATLAEKYRKSHHGDEVAKLLKTVKFVFEGDVLNMEDTPETHDMDSGDIVEVVVP